MKPITLLLSICCIASAASAAEKLPENGYYRCINHMSSRYVYVLDNHGTIDMGATSADLNAIELWNGRDRSVSDPATVLYFDHIGDRQYDVTAQGTGINKIIDYYVSLRAVSSLTDTYLLYASNSGLTKYLCDGERVLDNQEGKLSDNGEGKWRYWELKPIAADSENYFGITPDISCAGGELYSSFFAEFPFSFASAGMKALYVTKVDSKHGIAVVEETTGAIPGVSPVIIGCSSTNPSANRLDIGTSATASLQGNMLKGVYFQSGKYKHVNRVANDKATMRVPGLTADGKLGFVTCADEYLPRNKAYLPVPAGTPETLTVMTPAEYEDWVQAGIDEIGTDSDDAIHAIYNMMGVKVGDTREGTSSLTPGIYISNHRKIIVR